MKILHINTHDSNGGAARAASRLHHSLLAKGIESQLLVQHKTGDDKNVIHLNSPFQRIRSKVSPRLDALPLILYPKRTKTAFSSAWVPFSNISSYINHINPDIVHLHWVAGGMLSIEDLTRINKPIAWTLHDMWAFTGGCHIDLDCGLYRNGCGQCKVLASKRAYDLSKKIFNRKKAAFKEISQRLTITTPSRWLLEQAQASPLLQECDIVNIPNSIDTGFFTPHSKQEARKLLKLPTEKKIIMFGAMNALSDTNKGFKHLREALYKLSDEVNILIFGNKPSENPKFFHHSPHYFGQINNDKLLRLLYSAADAVIVPSLQENLSNTIMESMSCGTPVVAFDIGGNSDMVEHLTNGYLARPYDNTDLGHGIHWAINTPSYNNISDNAREKIVSHFSSRTVATRFTNIYEELISRHAPNKQ